jgi:hypothetical protein
MLRHSGWAGRSSSTSSCKIRSFSTSSTKNQTRTFSTSSTKNQIRAFSTSSTKNQIRAFSTSSTKSQIRTFSTSSTKIRMRQIAEITNSELGIQQNFLLSLGAERLRELLNSEIISLGLRNPTALSIAEIVRIKDITALEKVRNGNRR